MGTGSHHYPVLTWKVCLVGTGLPGSHLEGLSGGDGITRFSPGRFVWWGRDYPVLTWKVCLVGTGLPGSHLEGFSGGDGITRFSPGRFVWWGRDRNELRIRNDLLPHSITWRVLFDRKNYESTCIIFSDTQAYSIPYVTTGCLGYGVYRLTVSSPQLSLITYS